MIFPGEKISYELVPVYWFFCDLDTPILLSAVPLQSAAETAGSHNLNKENDQLT